MYFVLFKILPAVTLVPTPNLPLDILFRKECQVVLQRNKTGEVGRGRNMESQVLGPEARTGQGARSQPPEGVCRAVTWSDCIAEDQLAVAL